MVDERLVEAARIAVQRAREMPPRAYFEKMVRMGLSRLSGQRHRVHQEDVSQGGVSHA